MKNILNIIINILVTLFFVAIILIATKSKLGNPDISTLNSLDWTEFGPLELSPERARFALLYSLAENQSFKLDVQSARLSTPDLGYKNGHFVSLFAPGTSILMIPGYLIGKYFGAKHLGATLTIGIFALANVYLIYLISRRLNASRFASLIGSLIFITATPAFTYSGVIYQHHISTMLILLSLYLTILPARLWRLSLTFFLFGFSVLIDYPNAFFMLPIVMHATFMYVKFSNHRNIIKIKYNPKIILTAFSIIIPLTIYLAINHLSYGNIFQLSNTVSHVQALNDEGKPVAAKGADERSQNDIRNLESRKRNAFNFFKARHHLNGLYAFSVSPDRGVFVFTPVILLGFLGLINIYRFGPSLAQTILSVICLNVLLYGMRSDPWGGWAFGSRYLIPSFGILSISLSVAISAYRKNLIYLVFLFLPGGYSIFVNTSGAISSTANPPQVEVLSLEELSGRRERYSYDRNLEFLQKGKSKSYIYSTYLKNYISPIEYLKYITSILIVVFEILCLLEYSRKNI